MKAISAIGISGLVLLAVLTIGAGWFARSDGPAPAMHDAAADRAAMVSAFLADAPLPESAPPADAWVLSLPRDHGAHPDAPAETWTVTAALRTEDDQRFDLFLTLLRADVATDTGDAGATPWAFSTLWAGQAVLIAEGGARSGAGQRFGRVAGAAGHDAAEGEVWLEDWSMRYRLGEASDGLRLVAMAGDARFDLSLSPEKPVLAPDGDAVSAPRGFALPRLAVTGSVIGSDGPVAVTGTAWLDRSWGDLPLPGGPIAYDRLVLQMSNGSDLSLVRTRRVGRPGAETLDAVLVDPAGGVRVFEDAALTLEVQQDQTGLPAEDAAVTWRLLGEGFDLTASAEGGTMQDFLSPTWLGPVEVSGQIGVDPVEGTGLLLLTGGDGE
jgi:predicted secreted hydrolase